MHAISYLYTVSKKVPTFKLSVTLSNINQFPKFLHCWKAYEICYNRAGNGSLRVTHDQVTH